MRTPSAALGVAMRTGVARGWDAPICYKWPWVRTNGIPFWLVGEFTTHV